MYVLQGYLQESPSCRGTYSNRWVSCRANYNRISLVDVLAVTDGCLAGVLTTESLLCGYFAVTDGCFAGVLTTESLL